jgi:hypothetical protein
LSSGPAQLREAVADIILLAVSDSLLISPWSSYGQMAAVIVTTQSILVSNLLMNVSSYGIT